MKPLESLKSQALHPRASPSSPSSPSRSRSTSEPTRTPPARLPHASRGSLTARRRRPARPKPSPGAPETDRLRARAPRFHRRARATSTDAFAPRPFESLTPSTRACDAPARVRARSGTNDCIPKNRGTVGRRARLAIDPRRQRRRRDRAMDATGDATRARYFDIFPRSLARVRVDAIGRDGRSSALRPRVFRASSAERGVSGNRPEHARERGERERRGRDERGDANARGRRRASLGECALRARRGGRRRARAMEGIVVLWEV